MENQLSVDLELRRKRLQEVMQKNGIDGCILSTAVNVFYMAGCIYNGYFYLPAEGNAWHFVKRPDGIDFENTIYIRKPEQITEELKDRNIPVPKSLLLETDVLSYNDIDRLLNIFSITKAENASTLLRNLRIRKTPYELEQTRACAKKQVAVYKEVPEIFRRGMSDVELQIEIERLMRLNGSLGIFRSYGQNMDIFMGSLLVGDNAENTSPFDFALGGQGTSPVIPLGANGTTIKEGQTIMVDMAGNYSPWMTDLTRVFSVGKTAEAAYKAHQISLEIQSQIEQTARQGTACSELYEIAERIVKKNNLQDYFMGTTQQAKFIGHGVGLEINEPPVLTPRSKEILEENCVFALEPKFVIPKVGAVGIENTFVVTNSGIEKLTILEENIIEL